MRKLSLMIILGSLFLGVMHAQELTLDYEANRYRSLWTNSPFTLKPKSPTKAEAKNPLEDWSLAGVSRFPEGHFVILINKKQRKERIKMIPGVKNQKGFRVLEVQQDAGDFMKTRVRIDAKGVVGWVTYDPEVIKIQSSSGGRSTPNAQVNRPKARNNQASSPQPRVSPTASGSQNKQSRKPRKPRRRVLPQPAK